MIQQLQRHLSAGSLTELAGYIGITKQAVQNWKNRRAVTSRQLAGLVRSATRAGENNLQANAIRPLVEFFHIEKCSSKQGVNFEVLN
ncbi:hypothetical protein, partial [Klebsiella aerogenes]|uniref:hypothetical protein n=1 Tax=Klebsiella aerogenes TaxID=548 RepID=UPI0019532063